MPNLALVADLSLPYLPQVANLALVANLFLPDLPHTFFSEND
jgi:hypothetical protein